MLNTKYDLIFQSGKCYFITIISLVLNLIEWNGKLRRFLVLSVLAVIYYKSLPSRVHSQHHPCITFSQFRCRSKQLGGLRNTNQTRKIKSMPKENWVRRKRVVVAPFCFQLQSCEISEMKISIGILWSDNEKKLGICPIWFHFAIWLKVKFTRIIRDFRIQLHIFRVVSKQFGNYCA